MTKNTHASTLALLETNGDAVVNFIIDNNPAGIQSQMDSIGLLSSFKWCLWVAYGKGERRNNREFSRTI